MTWDSIHKSDHKCSLYLASVTVNHKEIGTNSQRILKVGFSNIKYESRLVLSRPMTPRKRDAFVLESGSIQQLWKHKVFKFLINILDPCLRKIFKNPIMQNWSNKSIGGNSSPESSYAILTLRIFLSVIVVKHSKWEIFLSISACYL